MVEELSKASIQSARLKVSMSGGELHDRFLSPLLGVAPVLAPASRFSGRLGQFVAGLGVVPRRGPADTIARPLGR